MKTNNYSLILLAFAVIFLNFSEAVSDLSSKKIITLKTAVGTNEILDKVVRVRFKSGFNYLKFAKYERLQSNEVLTPFLPYSESIKHNKKRAERFMNQSDLLDYTKAVQAEEKLLRTFVLEYDSDLTPELYCKYLVKSNPDIESAEPYYVDELMMQPNDAIVDQQIMLKTVKAFLSWDDESFRGASDIIIGISDSGMEIEHEDISGNIALNTGEIPDNSIDDDGNGYVDDYSGYNFTYYEDQTAPGYVRNSISHGMEVAGIAAAATNNGIGIAGTGFYCKLFPIKITKNNSDKAVYGYQSIIYAAVRGFQVLNCSWGKTKPFSQYEQDIVDYAVANGVSIVASGGNIPLGGSFRDISYPAGYYGVLGVGEVSKDDYVITGSMFSVQTGVLAPGEYNKSLSNAKTGYVDVSNGTSYAAPVVAGMLGLIRAKYRNLTALQAIEFARLCTDDISGNNPSYTFYLPGRVNFHKAATKDPFSMPSIKHRETRYYDNSGTEIPRLRSYPDEINMKIKVRNELGAKNVNFYLSTDEPNIEIINNEALNYDAHASSEFEISGFKFKINGNIQDNVLFRVDIYGQDFQDFFLFSFTNINDTRDFENKNILFTASDFGKFGTSVNYILESGQGFTPKATGNLLFNGGIISSVNNLFPASSVFGDYYKTSDYQCIKPLTGEDSNVVVLERKYDLHHYQLTAKYTIIDTFPIVRIDMKVKNLSEYFLINFASGYYFDWDLPPALLLNKTNYFDEALPPNANPLKTGGQFAINDRENIIVAAFAWSDEQNAQLQAAGFTGGSIATNSSLLTLLNYGITSQTQPSADIGFAVGMLFKEEIKQNEERDFHILLGYSSSKDSIAKFFRDYYTKLSVDEVNLSKQFNIFPNPSSDFININCNSDLLSVGFHNVRIYNTLGEIVFDKALFSDGEQIKLDINNLVFGNYYIEINNLCIGIFQKK